MKTLLKALLRMSIVASIIALLLCISFVFPIKRCIIDYPTAEDGEFYVVRYDCTMCCWLLTGDENGITDWNTTSDVPVFIQGVDLKQIVSADLWDDFQETYFVLWGKGEEKVDYDEGEDCRTIIMRKLIVNCTDWDVLADFSTHNMFRYNFSRKYLTLYDYKWFDELRMYDEVFTWH